MTKSAHHILIIFHDLAAGGTEMIALKLARQWVNAGRRVTLLCGTLDGPLSGSIPAGIELVTLSPEIGRSMFSRLKMKRILPEWIDRIKPDMVFLPGNFHLILAGSVARSKTKPLVIAKISNPVSPGSSVIIRHLGNYAFGLAARRVDWLVAMSSGLLNEAKLATASNNISVIFDPNVDGNAPIAARQKRVDPNAPIRLLAAGRLVAQKDFALALRVTAALAAKQDVHLTILGDGPKREQLLRLASRLGIADKVSMPGHAPSIIPALRTADILLVTSQYEGGPAVAVEALEQGIPVIATDCSHFLQDLLHDPAFGTVVPSRSANDIANAVIALRKTSVSKGFAPQDAIHPYRTDIAAKAYLRLFDRLSA
jgi:glycosyltransferase involved in cell wall biosynthesis